MAITGNDLLKKRRGSTNEDEKENENSSSKVSGEDLLKRHKTYQTTNTDSVDQKYIDSFMSDAKTFFTTAAEDYGGIGWSNASSYYDSRNATWQDLNTRADTIGAWLYKNRNSIDIEEYDSLNKSLDTIRGDASSVLDSFKSAVDYYSQWATEDEYNSWYEEYKRKEDEKQAILGAWDFEHYSQIGANIENPTYAQANGSDNFLGWKNPFVKGDEIKNIVTFSRDNLDDIERAIGGANNNADLASVVGDYRYQFLTDEEVSIYNYYLGKGDNKKAEEYLASLDDTLNQRWAGDISGRVSGNAFLEVTFAVSAGLDQFASGITNLDNFIKGTEADPTTVTQYANASIRENIDGVGGVAYDLIQNTAHMLPSILVGSLTGGVGGALTLGTSAVGNGYAEMRNLGYNEWQARGYGLLVGASEAALQYALGGISKLGGKVSGNAIGKLVSKFDNVIARAAITLGGNMASEGLEEAIQTVLEPAFKALVTGEDFESPEWEDVWYSALLGALSAGVLEGAPTIAGTAINNYQAKQMYGNGADLVTEAMDIDPNNAFAQKMQAKVDKGKSLSGGQINRLIEYNEQSLKTQDTAKMKSAVEKRLTELGESGDISKLADVIVKAQSGEKLTSAERSVLVDSKYGRRVSTELNPQSIESGEYTSGWAEKIGTERINSEAYNKGLYDLAEEVAGVTPIVEETVPVTENAPTKEIATESKFEASENGKTKIGDTEVTIKGIASIKDGEVMLQLEDGSEEGTIVKASDITFGSSEEALLYENVREMNMDVDTATDFVQGFNAMKNAPLATPQSVDSYILGFNEARTYGELGIPYDALARDGQYSNSLFESQKQIAYNRGKINGVNKAKVEQESRSISKQANSPNKYKHKGETHVSEIKKSASYQSLNKVQKAGVDGMIAVYKALGIDVYFFESPTNAKGERVGKNGYFNPEDRSVHIDLYAGASGQGVILFTGSHELTHYIKHSLPAKFKVFADVLFEHLEANGTSVAGLIATKKSELIANGRTKGMTDAEINDLAHEEVVADACETMMADGEVFAQISEKIKAKDKTLWETIKDFLTKLVARIKDAYSKLSPDSVAGSKVAEMLETAKDLQKMWVDMLVEASETSDLVEIDADSNSVSPMFSERTWTASEYVTEREETAKKISKALGVDIKTAYKYIDDINGIARLIADDRVRLDYEPNLDDKASVLKPNSEYKYTVDMSTLCAKRLLFTGTFDAIQKALPNTVFDSEDIVSLREMMQKRKYEVACGICYVESTRREIGRITQEFIDRYKVAQKTGKPISRINSSGKEVILKSAGKTFMADKNYTPNLGELNTTDIDIVKRDHREVYDAYLAFMNARGQAKPKLLETRAEYKGEILKHFKAKSAVEARNNAGGLRLQSFSDFEVPHLIDMMQIVMDMSRVGLKSQAYTKVPAFAEVFGGTGVKINLSLIAKGDGLDANGNLVFDDVEGINHKEAFKLRDKYSKNVGTILVGKTDAHIIAAMADPRIDYIIPFHKSSWKESLYDALGLTGYANYTDYQNEKPIDKDRKIKNYDPSEYWDFSKSGDENAQIYLAKCREDGRIPKFPQFQGYPGYWKLLIDFKMYDNDGVGSPQGVVRPTFNTEASERILSEYKGGHKSFPIAKDVVEDFVKEHKDKVKFSDRDSSYMDAVNRGDMETAQRMVDEAAREAGYTVKAYHGTRQMGFTVFDPKKSDDKISLFFTDNPKVAKTYARRDAKVKPVSSFSTMKSFKYEKGKKYTEAEMREAFDFVQTFDYIYGIPKFNVERQTIYHAGDRYSAKQLMELADQLAKTGIYEVFVNPDEMMEVDAKRHNWNSIEDPNVNEYRYKINYHGEGFDYFKAKADDTFTFELYKNGEVEHNGEITFSEMSLMLRERLGDNRAEMAIRHATDGSGIGSSYHEYAYANERGAYAKKYVTTRDLAAQAKKSGYKGLIIKNVYDNGGAYKPYMGDNPSNLYILFDSNQVKSADPVTYDDNGKVIPLSERFKAENTDIRYSDRNTAWQEGLSEADKATATKVISNLKIRAQSAKYGIYSSGTYTEERMDREIAYSYAEGVPDYANSYITWVNPIDFVYATTTSEKLREHLKEEAGDLNIDKLTNEQQPIYLTVNFETGQITGHEGRHRMLALQKSGIDRVAVIIEARNGDIYHTKPIEIMHLKGQNFGSYQSGTDFFLHDMLPLSQRYADVARQVFSFDGKNGVRFSDRSPDSISTRSLLANALETTAQNDVERNKLNEYKSKIALIESEQAKLAETRAKIKELSFAKGKRDTETLKKLRFEENQTANRINTYDKQLLSLESTKALKGVLEREKQMAYKRAEQKGKEALKEQRDKARERNAKTQRELMDRYTESRKKGIEGRKKTEMRYKIKKITSELDTLLRNPTAKKHIKEELRKEVANALLAINMDTVGAEERLAEIKRKLQTANDPYEINHLLESYNRISLQGDKLKDRLDTLRNAYEKIKASDDIELSMSYQEVIHNSIKNVSEKVGNTSIRNMTLEQLEMVYDLLSMIRKTIRNANEAFYEQKGQTIMQMAEAVNDQVRTVGGQPYKRNVISVALQKEGWHLLKPYVAFRTIGSITLTNLYKVLRNGEDTFYNDVSEAQAFIEAQYEKHGYKSWDMKKTKTFTAKSGKSFELTLEQMMTLYAYSRREQAHKHIIEGGIVFEDAIITEKNKWGIPVKYEVTTKDAFNISEDTFKEICDYLEKEHKDVVAFVDEMQKYLSIDMGAKGNEVSMELLGVKLFKEEFYLPIKSSQYYMNFKAEEAGEVKLKSPAFSKETVPHANNPIVLHNFTDLWAEHINDMSMYHSFVLALEDFTRVYNYKTKTDAKVETMDTKATLETAYPGVTNYINKFLKDMNGGVRAETVGWAEKLTSLSKKGAVLGSASVAIQQPSAIMRAMAMVNPKYFVTTAHESINLAKHKQDWAELKKYAPIAGIKEMGRFDVGMGQGTVDWIKSNKTAMDIVDDILGIAPEFMDEVTWVSIWNAVKRETVHNRKDLRPGSEEFLKVAGERFTDVISLSQVYDSVFSRSDLMRNKSLVAKWLTAFMGEPTTTLNMLWDSYVQGKRTGSKKGFIKVTSATTGAIVASIVFNSLLKAIVMAARDDDEDESYVEKYLEHFVGDLKDNLNPLTLVPVVKDVLSIFDGYDVERMDMSLISDLKQAMDAFNSDNKTAYEKWSGLIGSISAMFGVPVKNIERDIRAVYNTFFGKTEKTTKEGILNAISEGWTGKANSNGQQLYEAMLNGSTAQVERIKGRFKDQSAINSAIRKALRENDPRIHDAAVARNNGDIAEYTRIAKEIIKEGHFSQDDVVAAINAEINALNKGEGTTASTTDSNKATSIYKIDDYYTALVGRDEASAYVVKEDIIKTAMANGKDRDEAEADFISSFARHIRDQYDEGDISDYEAVNMLVNYGDKTEEDAWAKVQYWNFKQQYPDYDLSEEAVTKYYADVEPSGINIDVYYEYSKQKAKCKGTDSDGDGRADSGTKKTEIMYVIDSLPITYEQKDVLYYLNGWSASTIWQAPWH